ncbi:MAG: glycosyltransferase, partial [Allorhizobium sp.]
LDMNSVRSEFDAQYYRQVYHDLDGDDEALLHHFMTEGWRAGRNPNPAFQTSYYLTNYSDISEIGTNPFLHYVLFGRKEGRRPAPNTAVHIRFDKEAKLKLGLPSIITTVLEGKAKRPPRSIKPDNLDIHWVIPDFRAGSGGHMTIFRMVRYLEIFGHRNTIWIESPTSYASEREAWEAIIKSFQCVQADVRFVSDAMYQTSGDVVIATGWSTAYSVEKLSGFKARMYFVQDHEPEFYPTGSLSNLAKQSYDFDLGCICASPWLQKLMSDRYGRWSRGFYLAYEPEQYFVNVTPKIRDEGPLRIAVYGRSHTDRRCVQLALAGLELLAKERQDFVVHLFGQEKMAFQSAPFNAVNHGVLSTSELCELYNSCDIGLCFSGTNYSLVPKEMMASGLPLVEFRTESTECIFPKNTVTLAGPAPADIAAKISNLMDQPAEREKQREAALRWVKSFSWRESARVVERAIKDYLVEKGAKLSAPSVATKKHILFDVVVPTWNGKKEFVPVLEALRGQHLADQMQIHCVDSCSDDGTTEWLREQKDVSLTVIDQKDFQHGRTRNFGASMGSGPFIGFITQDAKPATKYWATDIVKMMRAVPEAAGLFGRHIAYPNHPYFVQEEITAHFRAMLAHPLVLSKHTNPAKWESGDIEWRQLLHFYSDNNSAMRRDVWNDIPYPEVDYGEDQVWARDIIEAGYSKIYAPTATVYHSHDYSPEQTYKRSKVESAFFYDQFGYELGEGSEVDIAQKVAYEQRLIQTWGHSKGISTKEIEMRKAIIAEKYRGWREGWMGAARGTILRSTG